MKKRLTYRDGEGRPQWIPELLEDESGLAGSMIREALATYEDNDPQKDPKEADILRESLSPREAFRSDGEYIVYLIEVINNLETARGNIRALVAELEEAYGSIRPKNR